MTKQYKRNSARLPEDARPSFFRLPDQRDRSGLCDGISVVNQERVGGVHLDINQVTVIEEQDMGSFGAAETGCDAGRIR